MPHQAGPLDHRDHALVHPSVERGHADPEQRCRPRLRDRRPERRRRTSTSRSPARVLRSRVCTIASRSCRMLVAISSESSWATPAVWPVVCIHDPISTTADRIPTFPRAWVVPPKDADPSRPRELQDIRGAVQSTNLSHEQILFLDRPTRRRTTHRLLVPRRPRVRALITHILSSTTSARCETCWRSLDPFAAQVPRSPSVTA